MGLSILATHSNKEFDFFFLNFLGMHDWLLQAAFSISTAIRTFFVSLHLPLFWRICSLSALTSFFLLFLNGPFGLYVNPKVLFLFLKKKLKKKYELPVKENNFGSKSAMGKAYFDGTAICLYGELKKLRIFYWE